MLILSSKDNLKAPSPRISILVTASFNISLKLLSLEISFHSLLSDSLLKEIWLKSLITMSVSLSTIIPGKPV